MFRENKRHLQTSFFDSIETMSPEVKERLKKSWSPVFYEHIFCKIDEKPFAKLYGNFGAPNFPVNILLSLELIKHLFNYSDDDLMDQFYFNSQVDYAVGIRHVGGLNLSERTFYEFRHRVYQYTVKHPGEEDLIFGQFVALTNSFLKVAGISSKEQRMDSTMFMPNIKKAGRIALAYDVLVKAVEAIPADKLPESLKAVLGTNFKTEILYKTKPSEFDSKMDQLLNLCQEAVLTLESVKVSTDVDALRIAKRFLKEQADCDESTNRLKAKNNKEISADSLQSAYEEDCTFRKKNDKSQSGYVANLSETCSEKNSVQLITDYKVAKNITSDVRLGAERLPVIKENTGCESMTTDGGYYGEDVNDAAATEGVEMHFTDMTGREPDSKLPVTAFEFEIGTSLITKCPNGVVPIRAAITKSQVVAHFPLDACRNCPLFEQCHVKEQKKDFVLRINQNAVEAAQQRERIEAEHKENTSARAAIEGTNSALKRTHGLGKLRVRGQAKCTVVVGLKVIAHNFKMFARHMIDTKLTPGTIMPATC